MNKGFARFCAGLTVVLLGMTVLFFSLSAGPVRSERIFFTATPEPSRIPLPAAPETLDDVQTLMVQSADCQPPCFWGFRPRYTTVDEILEFVQPEIDYSDLEENYGIEYFFTRAHDRDWTVTVLFNVEDGLLSLIDVTLHEPSEWLPPETFELSHLLAEMEALPEAYLFISMPQRRLYLTLVYDDAGVVAQYAYQLRLRGNAAFPTGDEPYLLCPRPALNDFINLWFQDGNGRELLAEYLVGFEPGATSSGSDWPVERMTGLDTANFIDQIVAHPNRCIEMFSYSELIEQGYEF